jgi:rsbT co-antagonist protein RsbR
MAGSERTLGGDGVRLGALLTDRRDGIVKDWTSAVAGTLRGRLTESELYRQVDELYRALLALDAVPGAISLDATEVSGARATLAELSRNWARQGFTPAETASLVMAVTDVAIPVLRDGGGDPFTQIGRLVRLVDAMVLYTFQTYATVREELISEQAEQLLELSTPVVKLWEGVLAVPLIGTLDSGRAQVVTEKMLQALVDTGSSYAIIDITGVPAVDTQVAQHILKTVVAARLMGAECIVSGIRPQIAQTVVALGIEFGDIVTKATLADALAYALRARGVDTSRRPGRAEA